MFAMELKLGARARGAAPAGARVEAISWLTAALVRNGSLLDEFIVARESNGWTVYGVAPARDAFRKPNWNEFVRRRIDGLGRVNLKRPTIRFLGAIPESEPACRCAETSGFFLFTTFLHKEPPVRCLDCNGSVPVYRLPRSETGEHSGLLSWWKNYQACDTLQIGCTVGERFGERQMSDMASSLSRSGLAVCKEIERLTGLPTYYYLHRAGGRSKSAEVRRKCPSCGGSWLLKEPLHGKFDFKCDKCLLLSNIAWNIR